MTSDSREDRSNSNSRRTVNLRISMVESVHEYILRTIAGEVE